MQRRAQQNPTSDLSRESHAMTPWANEVQQIQKYFEDWGETIARRHPKHSETTAWGQSLVKLQNEFEARMQLRQGVPSLKDGTTSFVQNLAQTQKYFEDWNAELMAKRRSGAQTAWAQSLIKMQKEFEARMQTRTNGLSENLSMTSWAEGLVQSQSRFEARMHARSRRQSKRGSAAAQAHHLMQEWDTKLAARQAQRTSRSSAEKADGVTPR